ncbi:MAG TPA: hypothetical protein VER55_01125 [Ardenticatenaceae bacterium]|nr:hypothetical protein [Ardenticatenaceae bacterium]
MTRLLATLRRDVTLQYRNGFYLASAFVVLVCIPLLGSFPAWSLPVVLPAFVLNAVHIGTFLAIGALVLLEKGEGTLAGSVVTPLRDAEYLASKSASLTLLSLLECLVIAAFLFGLHAQLLWLLLGTALLGTTYTMIGFVAIARYDSINEYLLPASAVTAFLMAPLVEQLAGWRHPLFLLHPVEPALVLLRAAFGEATTLGIAYGIGGGLFWAGLTFWWARLSFRRFVVRTVGT